MNWKIVLALLVSFALLMSSSYTMLIPFLPIYLDKELGASRESLSMWSGLVFAISFAISAFAAPLWGKLSDKMGKKPMIIRSSVLIAVTYFLAGIVTTPFELFLVRAFQGVAAGLWPACLVMLSAYAPKKKLGFAMGLMQSANITGSILGPLLGGILATSFGMRNSFFIGAVALSLISITTILFIKEPPKQESTDPVNQKAPGYLSLLKDKNLLILLFVVGFTNFVIMQIQPIVALYVEKLNQSSHDVMILSGLVLSLGGFAGAIAAPIWGKAGQKHGFYKTLTLSLIVAGSLIAMQGLPNVLWLFALMQFVCGLAFSGIFPSANSILVLFTPSNIRGTGFGLLFSAQMVGGAIGPIIGGFLVTFLSFNSVYFASGSVLVVLGLYLITLAPKTFKQRANANSTNN
ncbi:MAG: MFS transporter [Succinivibrio sp.]|nr:MFS transporter [Succinivibrio sp.]MCI5638756.1 MFS transporter [Succinivibrio sp.]MDY4993798.1 MFS transporter [Succinivibrio sp.]